MRDNRTSDWYVVKLKPKGLTFFSDSFYPAKRPRAGDVLVYVREINSFGPNTSRIQICNKPGGMVRQLAPYAAEGCFDLVRKATKKEAEALTKSVSDRKMDINAETKRRKNYVRGPAGQVSNTV
jgi:hypothetical protein